MQLELPTRQSTRIRRPPDFYGTYVNVAEHQSEPQRVRDALDGPEKLKWKEAMEADLSCSKSNDVWDLVKQPSDALQVGF